MRKRASLSELVSFRSGAEAKISNRRSGDVADEEVC